MVAMYRVLVKRSTRGTAAERPRSRRPAPPAAGSPCARTQPVPAPSPEAATAHRRGRWAS